MVFTSLSFLLFFPPVVLMTCLLPAKARVYWLLAASYYFYMCWNAAYVLLILLSTVITYVCARLLYRTRGLCLRRLICAFCLLSNLGTLFYFKYAGFFAQLLGRLLAFSGRSLSLPIPDVLVPVGISFYTFQALGYMIDVYRGTIPPEKNFFRYALFVSFFPQLVAGPIERSKNLLGQLADPKPFDPKMALDGILLMLWGFFLKLVLADRIALFVDTVYADPQSWPGFYLIVATLLFAFQVYCDFYGYSVIAMGAAKVLGISLMENFASPYLSLSPAEFWRNWHISLSSWFRDYLYFPLGGSRKGKLRRALNKMAVFLVSGLWHGASMTFVIWGGLNGLYQVAEDLIRDLKDGRGRGEQKAQSLPVCFLKGLFTFLLIDFSWIFFRAGSFSQARWIIGSMLTADNPWILFDDSLYGCGLSGKNFRLMLLGIALLLFADLCKKKGIALRECILRRNFWARCVILAAIVLGLLIFGIYGPSYEAASFIYFQF